MKYSATNRSTSENVPVQHDTVEVHNVYQASSKTTSMDPKRQDIRAEYQTPKQAIENNNIQKALVTNLGHPCLYFLRFKCNNTLPPARWIQFARNKGDAAESTEHPHFPASRLRSQLICSFHMLLKHLNWGLLFSCSSETDFVSLSELDWKQH